jgi:Cd2+/Zn2+-exporting ATPase/Cu+-exporting ATPase
MLASVGASAKKGVLIKGGKYIETLARADVLLIDKTGTLTLGKPTITEVVVLPSSSRAPEEHRDYSEQSGAKRHGEGAGGGTGVGILDENALLSLAASADRYSEHPFAEALRSAARERGLELQEATEFESIAGTGVRARINGNKISVGRSPFEKDEQRSALESQGKTVLSVLIDDKLSGWIAASDTLRSEVPDSLQAVKDLGIEQIELITGDNERVASSLARSLGISYRAGLMPEDKIHIVREYQSQGKIVVMIGDGINDAPALAQANVGIAMGRPGTDLAIEAAHSTPMREDWTLIPHLLQTAKRTMRVVKGNLAFTAVYNIVGLILAAFGFLPPMLAAALQSIPDVGILGNSARLLRQKEG